jgi:hypothetical protein
MANTSSLAYDALLASVMPSLVPPRLPLSPSGPCRELASNQELAEVLDDAADLVSTRGKATGSLQDSVGRVCLWGAVAAALAARGLSHWTPLSPYRYPMLDLFEQVLAQLHPNWHEDAAIPDYRFSTLDPLARWNDLPTTTGADVAKVLSALAEAVRLVPEFDFKMDVEPEPAPLPPAWTATSEFEGAWEIQQSAYFSQVSIPPLVASSWSLVTSVS